MTETTIDHDYAALALNSLKEANSFLSILESSLLKPSRFNNDLKYNMALMCVEKYFVAIMACYEELPSHHVPLGLYREAQMVEKELTPEIKTTCILVGKFEGICSLEDFGYRTPANEDLQKMVEGIKEIQSLAEKRVAAL